MDVSGLLALVAVRRVQWVPSSSYESPMASMAMQMDVPTQEIPVRPERPDPPPGGAGPDTPDEAEAPGTESGPVHDDPFQSMAPPLLSTATQDAVPVHDTAFSEPSVSMSCGCVQLAPFQRAGPPASAAMQKVGFTHETPLAAPQAPDVPDQPGPPNLNEFPSPSMVIQKAEPTHERSCSP